MWETQDKNDKKEFLSAKKSETSDFNWRGRSNNVTLDPALNSEKDVQVRSVLIAMALLLGPGAP